MKKWVVICLSAVCLYAQNSEPKARFIAGDSPLTEPDAGRAEDVARRFLEGSAANLSLAPEDLSSVYLAKQYQTDHNGVTHMVFRQQFDGIDVWNAEWVTNLDRN